VITNVGSSRYGANVWLTQPAGDAIEAQSFSQPRGDEYSFAFYGVGNGEYYVNVRQAPYEGGDGAGSKPIRVRVNGNNVSGVAVPLVPFGSIAGRVILEPLRTKDNKCESKHPLSIEEFLITARRNQEDNTTGPVLALFGSSAAAPNAKGEFAIRSVEPGGFHIEAVALDQAWYLRSITLPAGGRVTKTVDAGRNGFELKSGEHKDGLAVIVSEGAASLDGRVVPDKNGLLPGRLRVHLVPAEPQSSEDLLRFFETETRIDGSFKLTNLAPGRYWIVAAAIEQTETSQMSQQGIAWKAATRSSLRRDAEAVNVIVELKPCQRAANYELRYASPKQPAPPEAAPKRRPD